MADELVVREWETYFYEGDGPYFEGWRVDDQLAREHNATVGGLQAQLAAMTAHSENLDKSLTRTEEKLKAATETLERVNGRAQMADFDMGYVETSKALRDIRALCKKELGK